MKEKFIDYERKQYIENKRYSQHGVYSCGKEEIKSKKYLIHGTVEEDINKVKEVIDKMIAAGYKTDSFRLQIAFAKEHDEKNDVVQVVSFSD